MAYSERLVFDPSTGKLHQRVTAPSHEEFLKDPEKYPDFELVMAVRES